MLKAALNLTLFYNHVRPHHHLQGHTPAEAWAGINVLAQSSRMAAWMNMGEGVLQGYYADSGYVRQQTQRSQSDGVSCSPAPHAVCDIRDAARP
jgi:hypothetical protein